MKTENTMSDKRRVIELLDEIEELNTEYENENERTNKLRSEYEEAKDDLEALKGDLQGKRDELDSLIDTLTAGVVD
ncbi:MAG: hypothetical protein EOP45_21835, partial [Sphingobacteriaceae bacterium]